MKHEHHRRSGEFWKDLMKKFCSQSVTELVDLDLKSIDLRCHKAHLSEINNGIQVVFKKSKCVQASLKPNVALHKNFSD